VPDCFDGSLRPRYAVGLDGKHCVEVTGTGTGRDPLTCGALSHTIVVVGDQPRGELRPGAQCKCAPTGAGLSFVVSLAQDRCVAEVECRKIPGAVANT